ncbi:MAG TPA: sensor domain-containing diguanylate cyclase [Acidobacteriota bacterium]|nr:sensor domain-containing diguanylate cyclase [Acidobacteriota bacterium]
MNFRLKLTAWIIALEFILLVAVGIIVSSNLLGGGQDFLSPVWLQVFIALLVVGSVIAIVIASLTKKEIRYQTGAMHEVWEKSLRIMHTIPAGIVIVDPENHRIIEANKAALETFKAPKRKVIGEVCHKYLCPAEEGYCPMTDLGQEADCSERLLVTAKGEEVPILKSVVPLDINGKRHLLELFFDISQQKDLENRLKEAYAHQQNMADYDLLTGVLNRRAITRNAEAELCRAERGGALSVVMMDLDHFKQINDTSGHLAGDDVLRKAASVVLENIRPYDWLGRWGGEEFLLLLPDTGIQEAVNIAERLRKAIKTDPVQLEAGGVLRYTASFGIAGTAETGKSFVSLDTLISLADKALYRAKGEGRDRVCVAGSDQKENL